MAKRLIKLSSRSGSRPVISDEEKLAIGLPEFSFWEREELLPPEGAKITRYYGPLVPGLDGDVIALGLDPGQVHMGLAWVNDSSAVLYEIEMPSYDDAVERIMAITTALQFVLALCPRANLACIEGASFMAAYGQVPLAEARTASAIAILTAGVPEVFIVPPRQIRKGVFNRAEIRSQEMWPDLPENASSALGCAFYAHKIAKHSPIP